MSRAELEEISEGLIKVYNAQSLDIDFIVTGIWRWAYFYNNINSPPIKEPQVILGINEFKR